MTLQTTYPTRCTRCLLPLLRPLLSRLGTGYGWWELPGGRMAVRCYACCALDEHEQAMADGRAWLYWADLRRGTERRSRAVAPGYLWGGVVTNWPGSLRYRVVQAKRGRHNWSGVRWDVWFRVPGDPFLWWGVQYGEASDQLSCRRTHERAVVTA